MSDSSNPVDETTSSAADEPQSWRLIYRKKDDTAQLVPIRSESFTIGRSEESDLSLDDAQVSQQHAQLTRQGRHLIIEDAGTANGTLVNDQPIDRPYVLRPGDKIRLGSQTLVVEQVPGTEAAVPPPPAASPAAGQPQPSGTSPRLLGLVAVLALLALMVFGLLTATMFFFSMSDNETTSEPVVAPASPTSTAVAQALTTEPEPTPTPLDPTDTPAPVVIETIDSPPTRTPQVRLAETPLALAPTVTLPSADTPLALTPVTTASTLILKAPLLVVRTGPSTLYPPLGRLEASDQPEIVGRADVGQGNWWQIDHSSLPDGLGWVSGDADLVVAINAFNVPQILPPSLPTRVPTATPIPTATPVPTQAPTLTPTPNIPIPTSTATTPPPLVVRPPDGKTLLIVSNRSFANQPALLTLSGGKSAGGGLPIDAPAGGEVQVVLEPDFYRAIWTAPARNFSRGADFTAVPGKVITMWIVPEDGRTDFEEVGELIIEATATPTPVPTPSPTPSSGLPYTAPADKALLVLSNRSFANEFGTVTISGGSFGGGREFILDAGTEFPVELVPGNYRAIWTAPGQGGFTAGRQFDVFVGDVILSWMVPEERQVFMQFPGQAPFQVNN